MNTAIDAAGLPITPYRRGRASCPNCRAELIARCGCRVAPHWAHKRGETCQEVHTSYGPHKSSYIPDYDDPAGEIPGGWHWWGGGGETGWHKDWKAYWPEDSREVTRIADGITHRADVLDGLTGTAIEFQHSPIDADAVASREEFWPWLIWVFDARQVFERGKLVFTLRRPWPVQNSIWEGYEYVRLRCDRPLAIMKHVTRPMFWDIGMGVLLEVKRYQYMPGVWGYPGAWVVWGNLLSKADFLRRFEISKERIIELLGLEEWPALASEEYDREPAEVMANE